MIWDTIRLNRKIKPTDSGVNIFYPLKGLYLVITVFPTIWLTKNFTMISRTKEEILF